MVSESTKKVQAMKDKILLKKLAKLETVNDQLSAEIQYLERLTRALGFAEGLKTLKAAAIEMLEAEQKREAKTEDGANPPLSS
jgi:hypothetical protein